MSSQDRMRFNPPPGWPAPPVGWRPPRGWTPDPSWPTMPPGWELWITDAAPDQTEESAKDRLPQPRSERKSESVGDPASLHKRAWELETQRTDPPSSSTSSAVARGIASVNPFDDEQVLRDAGIYRYHHPLESAASYRERLLELDARIAEAIRGNAAIEASTNFTLDGSLAKGKAMVNALSRLMLRAYNAEAENAVEAVEKPVFAAFASSRRRYGRLGSQHDLSVAASAIPFGIALRQPYCRWRSMRADLR